VVISRGGILGHFAEIHRRIRGAARVCEADRQVPGGDEAGVGVGQGEAEGERLSLPVERPLGRREIRERALAEVKGRVNVAVERQNGRPWAEALGKAGPSGSAALMGAGLWGGGRDARIGEGTLRWPGGGVSRGRDRCSQARGVAAVFGTAGEVEHGLVGYFSAMLVGGRMPRGTRSCPWGKVERKMRCAAGCWCPGSRLMKSPGATRRCTAGCGSGYMPLGLAVTCHEPGRLGDAPGGTAVVGRVGRPRPGHARVPGRVHPGPGWMAEPMYRWRNPPRRWSTRIPSVVKASRSFPSEFLLEAVTTLGREITIRKVSSEKIVSLTYFSQFLVLTRIFHKKE
jgi:hypothetical protein